MRWWTVALMTSLLSACGLKDLMPTGPVLTPWERHLGWSVGEERAIAYTSEPVVDFPVIPAQVWGAAYELDLVIVSRHPEWNMHEYAKLVTPRGVVWLAKDARESTRTQSLVADLPDIHAWFPELPLERRAAPVRVVDRSDPDRLDLEIAYDNIDGEPVEVRYQGPPPARLEPERNGNTMGHSRDQLLAVLDVSHRRFGRRAELTIGGEPQRIDRILGIVPFRMALVQTQGGLATGRLVQRGLAEGFETAWETGDGDPIARPWGVHRDGDVVEAVQRDEIRTLRYRWRDQGGALELISMTAEQWGRATPTTHVAVHPPLPDLRRRFEGRHRSRYVIDVNGQDNHAVGTLEAWWEDDGPRVAVVPEAPAWTTDRPMQTSIHYRDGAAEVAFERVD